MTAAPEWITLEDALLLHAQLLAQFGGAHGIRDQGLLEWTVARPHTVFEHESQDLFTLASAYAHGIAKNNPFVDGNKRMAFVGARIFLGMNDVAFDPPEAEAVVMVDGLASDEVDQAAFAQWLRKHSTTRKAQKRAK